MSRRGSVGVVMGEGGSQEGDIYILVMTESCCCVAETDTAL